MVTVYYMVLVFISPVISTTGLIPLTCSPTQQELVVDNSAGCVAIGYPGTGATYPSNANCQWKIRTKIPNTGTNIRFNFFDTEAMGNAGCYDYVTINGPVAHCPPPLGLTYSSDGPLLLTFRSDGSNVKLGFRAVVWEQKNVTGVCDIGTGNTGDGFPLLSYKFKSELLEDNIDSGRGIDFTMMRSDDLDYAEIIMLGANLGVSGCMNMNTLLKPIADIPSCHVDDLVSCDWRIPVDPEPIRKAFPEIEADGKVFAITKPNNSFRTYDTKVQVDKICMYIEYFSNSSFNINIFGRSIIGNWSTSLATIEMKRTQEWIIHKIYHPIPSYLSSAMFQLKLTIEPPKREIVYVKKIYGCNPFVEEDRYRIKKKPINLGGDDCPAFNTTIREDNMILNHPKTVELVPHKKCKNGGKMGNGVCYCPVGFTGSSCEIGCGRNKFGKDCQSKCSVNKSECAGFVYCKEQLGCFCAPGWKGARCQFECARGEYGAGCGEQCGHCEDMQPCDPYTGSCHDGCERGYVPPLCKDKYTHLTTPPVISDYQMDSVVISANVTNETVAGEGTPFYYQVQYMSISKETLPDEDEVWVEMEPKELGTRTQIMEVIPSLESKEAYMARIILYDEELMFYDGDDVASTSFETLCSENKLNFTPLEITTNSIKIKWESGSTIRSKCDFQTYEVQISGGHTWNISFVELSQEHEFTSLLPNTEYTIRVRQHHHQIPLSFYYFKTRTQNEIGGQVEALKAKSLNGTSILLKWRSKTSCCSNFAITYECKTVLFDTNSKCEKPSDEELVTTEQSIIVTGLCPQRRYLFKVRQIPGKAHSKVTSATKYSVPEHPPKLLSVEPSAIGDQVTVKWYSPEYAECDGFIKGYLYKLLDETNKTLDQNKTPNTQVRVPKGSGNKLLLYIINKSGKNEFAPLIVNLHWNTTSENASAPIKVTGLSAYKKGRDTVGLRWSLTESCGQTLKHFAVEYEGKKFSHRPQPCTPWPQEYCFTINGLKPDTQYTFKVSAVTEIKTADNVPATVDVTTTESAPESPVDLRVRNISDRSLTLAWSPPDHANGILRSFLIKIEQTSSFDMTLCCQYYPKREITVDEEMPEYIAEIGGLEAGSTYALSLMAETVWLGPAVRLNASTRPPQPAVHLPSVRLIQSAPALEWEIDNGTSLQDHTPLLKGRLLLVLPESETPNSENSMYNYIKDKDLRELIVNHFGPTFYVAAELEEGIETVVGTDSRREGRWGFENNRALTKGNTYTLAVVAITKYGELHNIGSVLSKPFVAE